MILLQRKYILKITIGVRQMANVNIRNKNKTNIAIKESQLEYHKISRITFTNFGCCRNTPGSAERVKRDHKLLFVKCHG